MVVRDQTTLLLPEQDGTPPGLIRLTAGEEGTLNEESEDDRRTGGQPAQITPRV